MGGFNLQVGNFNSVGLNQHTVSKQEYYQTNRRNNKNLFQTLPPIRATHSSHKEHGKPSSKFEVKVPVAYRLYFCRKPWCICLYIRERQISNPVNPVDPV